MADWEVKLPGKVAEGDTGHVEDHNTIVDAIKEARTNIDEIPKGAKGEPGADGKDGAKGEPGADGKDGFGTEKQYNDIISRLKAVEAAVDGGDDGGEA